MVANAMSRLWWYPVVIIDALDECGIDGQERQRNALIDTIIAWRELPSTLKLIVTGRDDRVSSRLRKA